MEASTIRHELKLIMMNPRLSRTIPTTLHISSALWICAVLTGLAESVLGVIGAVRSDAPVAEIWTNVGLRGVIYGVLIFTALRLAAGRRWPRPVLAVGLGVIGLGTLIIAPIRSVLDGSAMPIGTFLSTAPVTELAFAAMRTCHVAFVLIALATMFAPTANAFHRRRPLEALSSHAV